MVLVAVRVFFLDHQARGYSPLIGSEAQVRGLSQRMKALVCPEQ